MQAEPNREGASMSRFSSSTQALLDEADVELCNQTSEDGSGVAASAQVAGAYRLRVYSWL